jgi:hypothetical protein
MKNILLAALICCGLVAHVPVYGGVGDDGLRLLGALNFVAKVGKVASVVAPVVIVGTLFVLCVRARINNMDVETQEKLREQRKIMEMMLKEKSSNGAQVSPGLSEDFKKNLDDLLARRQKEEASKK